MTTVCPALLPPWYLTTKSTLSPSRSVALPLPSSPHWAPASTMAGILPTPSCEVPAGCPQVRCLRGVRRSGAREDGSRLRAGVGQELLAPLRLERGAGTAVENQCERLAHAILGADRLLDVVQDRRPQLDVPWLVDTVDVPERRGEDVP